MHLYGNALIVMEEIKNFLVNYWNSGNKVLTLQKSIRQSNLLLLSLIDQDSLHSSLFKFLNKCKIRLISTSVYTSCVSSST